MKRFLGLAVLAACGGASAKGPLTVPIGTTREVLVHQLRDHAYCQDKEPPAPKSTTEMFPRCSGPGAEYGQSWVVATYDDGGRVVKVQRWEKFAESDRGTERWNELVEARSKDGAASDAAKQKLGELETLPAGTRTWVAFERDHALVGVYLLDPRPPEYANVLEEIVEVTAEAPR